MMRERADYLRLKFKVAGVIRDSLWICDIEYDKIPLALKNELNGILDELSPDAPAVEKSETKLTKLSITKESLESLSTDVMTSIIHGLSELGITDPEKINLLKPVITGIIKYEKDHRDLENT